MDEVYPRQQHPDEFLDIYTEIGPAAHAEKAGVSRATIFRWRRNAQDILAGQVPLKRGPGGMRPKLKLIIPAAPKFEESEKSDYIAVAPYCAEKLRGVMAYSRIQQVWYVRSGKNEYFETTEKPFSKALHRLRQFCKSQKITCETVKLLGLLTEYLPSEDLGIGVEEDRQRLAFANGMVAMCDADNGTITRPVTHPDYVYTYAPWAYDPCIDTSEVDALCDKLFGVNKKETLRLLSKALWGLLPRTILIFIGAPGTGKTVFVKSLRKAIGDVLCAELAAGVLCRKNPLRPEDNALFMLPLEHARFIFVSELPKNTPLGSEIAKQFASTGDDVPFKAKGRYHNMPVRGTIILTGNTLPLYDATDQALVERLKIVYFTHVFEGPRMTHAEVEATAERLASPLLHLLLKQQWS